MLHFNSFSFDFRLDGLSFLLAYLKRVFVSMVDLQAFLILYMILTTFSNICRFDFLYKI
jgi:hypothetical protein